MPDTQQGTREQQIVKIKLPAAQTQPRELDGNWRSWGRGGTRGQAGKPASRQVDREAEAG